MTVVKIEPRNIRHFRTMETKLIFVLILHICLGQWNNCFDYNERPSKEELKYCFLDNASLDPCTDYDCSGNTVCNSINLTEDVACLINYCQRKCNSKEKPCVIGCLNFDSCNDSETEEEFMDCIRNSTVNSKEKIRSPDPLYKYFPRYTSWRSRQLRDITLSPEAAIILVPIVLICSFCAIFLCIAWQCFAGGPVGRGGVSTVGPTTVVNPQPNPQGPYFAQNMPTIVAVPFVQQSPGPVGHTTVVDPQTFSTSTYPAQNVPRIAPESNVQQSHGPVGHTTVVGPQTISTGTYPAQNVPMIAPGPSAQQLPGPIVQQSPGPGMTSYPVENQFVAIRGNQTT